MRTKELQVPFNAPLKELDTEIQTYGCRANNPDICANNSITNICAFTSEDCICKETLSCLEKTVS